MAWNLELKGTPQEVFDQIDAQLGLAKANAVGVDHESDAVLVAEKVIECIADTLQNEASDAYVVVSARSSSSVVPLGTMQPAFTEITVKITPAQPVRE